MSNPTLSGPGGATTSMPLAGTADDKTAQTIAAMRAFVHDTDRTGVVNQWAVRLAASCPQKNYLCQMRRIYDTLKLNIRFKADAFGVEHLRHPDILVAEITRNTNAMIHCSADCDDVAMLGAALLRAMGFRAAFITTATMPGAPFSHVYYGAQLPGGDFVPQDPQERIPFGHESPRAVRRAVWWVDS